MGMEELNPITTQDLLIANKPDEDTIQRATAQVTRRFKDDEATEILEMLGL